MASIGLPIRVEFVDPHYLFRAGLRALIERWEGIQVVGDTGEKSEAVALIQNAKPHIVLMELDLNSGEAAGLELLSKLVAAGKARTIVVTHLRSVDLHHAAIQAGARGLVLKEHSPEQLRNAILKVHAGEVWLDDRLTTSIITKIAQSSRAGPLEQPRKSERLTKRESELANLAGTGLSNKEIAKRLFISETTVRHHLTSIFRKLGVANRVALVIELLGKQAMSKPPAPSILKRAQTAADASLQPAGKERLKHAGRATRN